MQLTIKTLTQSIFKVDIEPDKTVKDLKEKIEKDHGKEYPVGAQKLIYSGKILADENKLSEYQIDEKKFVVLMITRPPPVQKPPASSTTTTEKTATQTEPTKPAKTEEKSRPTTRSSTSTTSAPASSTTPTTTTTSSSSASSQAAANPTNTSTSTTTNNNRQSTTGRTSMAPTPTAAATGLGAQSQDQQLMQRLSTLMNQPHFRQIQDLIQQSPHLLSTTIEALAGSDPEMYNFITENPDIFVNALNHPPQGSGTRGSSRRSNPSAGSTTTTQSNQQQQHGTQQALAAAAAAALAASRQQPAIDQLLGSSVSEHDKEAIERLKELGFSEYLAIQAYMACDKDEQLAANLLFQMDQ